MPDKRWRVAIDLSGAATGHRTLTADNCAQLARASALIIALSANPEAALDLPADEASASPAAPDSSPTTQPPATSASTSAPSSSARPEPPRPTEPSAQAKPPDGAVPNVQARDADTAIDTPATRTDVREKAPRQRKRFPADVFIRGGLESGALPTRTLWAGLGARARIQKLPLSFGAMALVTQTTRAMFTNTVGARFRQAAVQARVCAEPWSGTLVIEACGGLQLTWLWAQGFVENFSLVSPNPQDTVTSMNTNRWGLAPLGSLGLGLEVTSRWTIEAGGDLILPFERWEYFVDDNGPRLFRPSALQFLLYVGVGYRLN